MLRDIEVTEFILREKVYFTSSNFKFQSCMLFRYKEMYNTKKCFRSIRETVASVCVICKIFVAIRDIFHRVPIFTFTRFRGRKAYRSDPCRVLPSSCIPRFKAYADGQMETCDVGSRLALESPETPCVATLNNTRAYFSIAHAMSLAPLKIHDCQHPNLFSSFKRQKTPYKFELLRETNARYNNVS